MKVLKQFLSGAFESPNRILIPSHSFKIDPYVLYFMEYSQQLGVRNLNTSSRDYVFISTIYVKDEFSKRAFTIGAFYACSLHHLN